MMNALLELYVFVAGVVGAFEVLLLIMLLASLALSETQKQTEIRRWDIRNIGIGLLLTLIWPVALVGGVLYVLYLAARGVPKLWRD